MKPVVGLLGKKAPEIVYAAPDYWWLQVVVRLKDGVTVERVSKVSESTANVADLIRAGKVDLVINTPFGRAPRRKRKVLAQFRRECAELKRLCERATSVTL